MLEGAGGGVSDELKKVFKTDCSMVFHLVKKTHFQVCYGVKNAKHEQKCVKLYIFDQNLNPYHADSETLSNNIKNSIFAYSIVVFW